MFMFLQHNAGGEKSFKTGFHVSKRGGERRRRERGSEVSGDQLLGVACSVASLTISFFFLCTTSGIGI
jgi:hypothetical protein